METIKDEGAGLQQLGMASSITTNRIAYLLFMMIGLSEILKKDWGSASIYWGAAILFDPFNSNIKWDERPLYQRIWLYVQVSLVFLLFFL